jgi:Flp pilus assembly pilin Flp
MLLMIRDEGGATFVEYGVLLMLVALVAFSAVELIGPEVNGIFMNVASIFFSRISGH